MASESGLKSGLCGYMVTWPPPEIDGFVIPGSFSRGPETHPVSLQAIRELDMSQRTDKKHSLQQQLLHTWQCTRLGVRASSLADAAATMLKNKIDKDYFEKFYQVRRAGMEIYTDVFIEQTKRFQPNLSMYVFTLVDSTSHNYWKFMEPERFSDVSFSDALKHASKIQQAYEVTDKMIGRALQELDQGDTNIFIVSDHGFQSVPEAQGTTPERTVRILPEALIEHLGWDKQAIRTFNIRGATYFRNRRDDGFQNQKMLDELAGICVEGSSLQLFNVTFDPYDNIEITLNRQIGDLNRLPVRLHNGRTIAAEEIIAGDIGAISGDHHPEGIVIAAGPAIRQGMQLTNASVLDITPTLLALLGLPVGNDMDGRVLQEALNPDFLSANPIQYIDSWQGESWSYEEDNATADEALNEQLRSLGYL